MHKISERIQKSVLRTLGKMSKTWTQNLLSQAEITEATPSPSMQEILHKQGASRGLFIVNEFVYQFFVKVTVFCKLTLNQNIFICTFPIFKDNVETCY